MLRLASKRLLQQLAAGGAPAVAVQAGAAAPALLLAVRGAKTTTGIVGLPLVPDARNVLKEQLQAVLDAIQVIPADAEYRRSVEKTVRWKLAAVESDAPDEQVEELLGRQLESDIKLCREELTLIPKMAEWKPWDVPADYKVEMLTEQQIEGKRRKAAHQACSFDRKLALFSLFFHGSTQIASLLAWHTLPASERWQRVASIVYAFGPLLIPLLFPEWYIRGNRRSWVLAIYRVGFFSFPLLRQPRGIQKVLGGAAQPGARGMLKDLLRLIWGSRLVAVMSSAAMVPLSLLGLVPQLALLLYAVAMVRANPSLCSSALTTHPLTRQRIRSVHDVLHLAGMLLPGGIGQATSSLQHGEELDCESFLTFLFIMVGVVLPLVVLVKTEPPASLKAWEERRQRANSSSGGSGGGGGGRKPRGLWGCACAAAGRAALLLEAGMRELSAPNRTLRMKPVTAAQRDNEDGTAIEAASMRHAPGLALFWSGILGGASWAALGAGVRPDLLLLVDTTIWFSVVSSISLMEAWVKFRAPLLERHVGVDVGRRVFRGQYAMEAACALTACGLLWSAGGGSVRSGLSALAGSGGWMLAGAAAILLLELGLVFPALDLRGKALIASAAEPAELTPRQQAYVHELQEATAARSLPPPFVHLVSVLLAVTQVALLGGCLWQLLLRLAV
ncbi:putative NADH dehydrogenase [ubiquinone] 1 alpha subcomplex subunit mitochondrial [Chlorella sorokiniana]|uniref:NADH dehydrogenase [ubiquinone] 1 alpha subcomplex subunit mitochondrial n=1 Tax=Chlorella sorokiniana TaxID=3076 RepID=A0A2P6TH84_CHLSO|nr:putative NADH dehydrogenase [ubiquinone] 1 alpha subcomplex subunit mitochondrial [Chlorella sorokiniana]|eukprot:PRW33626.1 putative NADH dehydrogenase [ubiquinone] 1 alpha subcomplex subunit mitochondrial [Chlorella sorokiniana]